MDLIMGNTSGSDPTPNHPLPAHEWEPLSFPERPPQQLPLPCLLPAPATTGSAAAGAGAAATTTTTDATSATAGGGEANNSDGDSSSAGDGRPQHFTRNSDSSATSGDDSSGDSTSTAGAESAGDSPQGKSGVVQSRQDGGFYPTRGRVAQNERDTERDEETERGV